MTSLKESRHGWVVDASVAVKWFVPEVFSREADAIARSYVRLIAPDILWAELGNVLWKKWRLGLISSEEVEISLETFARSQIRLYPTAELYREAWRVASGAGRTFYDSLYLALAATEDALLVTADARFYNAISSTPWRVYCVWIEEAG
jgi:predicted nucleic acid-binding protein